MISHAMDLDEERPLERYDAVISVRLMSSQQRRLVRMARNANLTPSEFTRGIIREYIDHHKLTREKRS